MTTLAPAVESHVLAILRSCSWNSYRARRIQVNIEPDEITRLKTEDVR